MTNDPGYDLLIRALEARNPGRSAKQILAKAAGVATPTVYAYRRLPPAYLVMACRMANVPPWQVRPDLFSRADWDELGQIPEFKEES